MNKYLLLLSLSLMATPTLAQTNAPTPEKHLPTVTRPAPEQGIAAKASQNKRYATAPLPEKELIDNKIYFFAHAMCTACKDAFIFFETNHRDLNIPITDMKYHENLLLYKQCVKKFNINNDDLHLPLICMGDHYIMGWDDAKDGQRFNEYLKDFQKKQQDAEHVAISDAVDERVGKDTPQPKDMLPAGKMPIEVPTLEQSTNNSESVAQSLEKLKGSEPIEPTAIVREENK